MKEKEFKLKPASFAVLNEVLPLYQQYENALLQTPEVLRAIKDKPKLRQWFEQALKSKRFDEVPEDLAVDVMQLIDQLSEKPRFELFDHYVAICKKIIDFEAMGIKEENIDWQSIDLAELHRMVSLFRTYVS